MDDVVDLGVLAPTSGVDIGRTGVMWGEAVDIELPHVELAITMDHLLGKGASGACVQNLNIMAGLPETAGLRL